MTRTTWARLFGALFLLCLWGRARAPPLPVAGPTRLSVSSLVLTQHASACSLLHPPYRLLG
jgi:hypothetical protein